MRQLIAEGSQLGLVDALSQAEAGGHERVAKLLHQPANGASANGAAALLPHTPTGSLPPDLLRAAEADVRAIESWLRSGVLSGVNDTERLEGSVQALLSAWGGHSLQVASEEEVASVLSRLRSRGVWVDMSLRVCGGYMLRFRADCWGMEVERLLMPVGPFPVGKPSVAISRRGPFP